MQVFFNIDFQKSIARTSNAEIRKEVISLLAKLSSGWREPSEERKIIVHDGTCSQLLETYKVDGQLNLVWTVDIPRLAKHLDILFGSYTVNKMHRCKHRCDEGYELNYLIFFIFFSS